MKPNSLKAQLPVLAAVAVLILIGIGLVRSCSTGRESRLVGLYERPGGDTLAVAIEMSPLTYTFANDTAEGFDYEILRDIAALHNLPLHFYPVTHLEEAYKGLDDGQYDIVVANMPATSGLREYFALTDAVYLDRQVLVQRRNADSTVNITGQLDLRGDTVYLAPGSPVRSRLRNMAAEMGDTIDIVTLPDYNSEHLAIMTARGDIKHAVVSEAVARKVAADYPNLDYSTPVSFNQFQVWALAPQDSILRDSLNVWLNAFKATPRYQTLATRYL